MPIVPMEHHYLLTGDVDELADFDGELPLVLDLDGEMYLRQEQKGVLLGVYEQNSTPWAVDGMSWDYGETDLLEPRLDDVADALTKGFDRKIPTLCVGARPAIHRWGTEGKSGFRKIPCPSPPHTFCWRNHQSD